jgi:hypothetical protein
MHISAKQNPNVTATIVDEAIQGVISKIEHDARGFPLSIAVERGSDSLNSGLINLSFPKTDCVLDPVKIHDESVWMAQLEVRVFGFIGRGNFDFERFTLMAEGNILHNGRFFCSCPV